MSEFTRTETVRRLRAAAKEYRRIVGLPQHYRVEVGHRVHPRANTDVNVLIREDYPEHDDLSNFDGLRDAAIEPSVRAHGAEVHLYFSSTGTWGELESVGTVWLGTPDHEPRVLTTDTGYRAKEEAA